MLYLLVNITGRFSVAIFGSTYNLVDDTVDVYSTLSTNWTSSVLLTKNPTDFVELEKNFCNDSTLCENATGFEEVEEDLCKDSTLCQDAPFSQEL